MIIEPDFLTHWKTRMLIAEMDDPTAPLYVIALWAHCQLRKCDRFIGISKNALKAICHFSGPSELLFSSLQKCGFLDIEDETWIVHDWADANAKLIANWSNGITGGRPQKNPTITHKKPNDNPTQTHGNPTPNWPNPTITDREDREDREEKIKKPRERAVVIPDGLSAIEGFREEWDEFRKHRRKKRAAMTPRAEELILKTLSARPKDAMSGLQLAIARGWQGFNWSWFDNEMQDESHSSNGHEPPPHDDFPFLGHGPSLMEMIAERKKREEEEYLATLPDAVRAEYLAGKA